MPTSTTNKRLRKSVLGFLLLLITISLTGCAIQQLASWPGVTASGSRVYVAYEGRVVALDVAERQEAWTYTAEGGVQFYAPPLVSDGRVILGDFGAAGGILSAGSLTVNVHALEDGDTSPPNVIWIAEDQLTGRVFGAAARGDGRLYLGTADNQFYALDASSGQKIWEFRTGNAIWDNPILHEGTVYFTALDKKVYALDGATGGLQWETALPGASASSPAHHEELGLLYVGSFDGKLYALNREDGEIIWTAEAADWVWGGPVLQADIVYYTDLAGGVYAAEAADGSLVWGRPAAVPGSVEAPVAIHEGKIFVVSGESEGGQGYVTAFDLNGEQLWQVTTAAPVRANPVIADGALVVAFAGDEVPLQVVRYNLESGASEWQYTPATE